MLLMPKEKANSMRKLGGANILLLVLAALGQLPLCAHISIAQNNPQKAERLDGLSYAEAETKFGKPDDKIEKSSGGAEWKYGSSTLFFSGGKIMAWSDAGELKTRERRVDLEKAPVKHDDSLSGEWENPWTPGKRHDGEGEEEFTE